MTNPLGRGWWTIWSAASDGVVDPPEVEDLVDDSWTRLRRSARIRTYLPGAGPSASPPTGVNASPRAAAAAKPVPQVLFLCVENAGRSQMAAALLEHHALGRVDARSAGSRPGRRARPARSSSRWPGSASALDEAYPKPLTDEVALAADVVVIDGLRRRLPGRARRRGTTTGTCPTRTVSPRRRPSIRDDIDRRVRALLAELTATSGATP